VVSCCEQKKRQHKWTVTCCNLGLFLVPAQNCSVPSRTHHVQNKEHELGELITSRLIVRNDMAKASTRVGRHVECPPRTQ